MITGKPFHPTRQRGAALIITLMISVLLSLLGMYGAGILVLDTRSAANDFRAREAMAAAESGTEQGLGLLNANRMRISVNGLHGSDDLASTPLLTWTTCTSTASPCLPVRSDDRTNWQYLTINASLTSQPVAGSFSLFLLTPSSGPSSRLVYNIVAIGLSADGTSNATLKQGAYFYPLLLGNVSTPLAASNVSLSGSYSIITDSNGGGTGVPVSVWSDKAITPGGNFASCHIGDFVSGACTASGALSKSAGGAPVIGPDLVGNDPAFPPDLFQFLFGVAASDYQKIKDQARVVADCGGLSGSSSGLIWVTGTCNPPVNIGTPANPVLLVVQGNASLNGGVHLYGLLYMFDPLGGAKEELSTLGNSHLHGAILTHHDVDLKLNGSFVLEFDKGVLENVRNSPSARGLARIPGAWSDVQ